MLSLKQGATLLLLTFFVLPARLHAAAPAAPFDLDLKYLERQEGKEKKKPQHPKKPASGAKEHQEAPEGLEMARYTVKPGDHIFKILMVHFGMSNEAAERLIPEVARINHIENIKVLTVGKTLLIPGKRDQERLAKRRKPAERRQGAEEELAEAAAGKPAAPAPGAVASPPQPAPAPVARAVAPAAAAATQAAQAPPAASAAELAPAQPPAPAVPEAITWICPVTDKDPAKVVDAVLNALSVPWSKNRIVQSSEPAFSIRVDRYFEYKKRRYIVSIGESDPYNITLIKLLEAAGYKVLRLNGQEDFDKVNRRLFALIGVVRDYGAHPLAEGKAVTGYLVQQEDAAGRRVVISPQPADPLSKWVLPAGCGSR